MIKIECLKIINLKEKPIPISLVDRKLTLVPDSVCIIPLSSISSVGKKEFTNAGLTVQALSFKLPDASSLTAVNAEYKLDSLNDGTSITYHGLIALSYFPQKFKYNEFNCIDFEDEKFKEKHIFTGKETKKVKEMEAVEANPKIEVYKKKSEDLEESNKILQDELAHARRVNAELTKGKSETKPKQAKEQPPVESESEEEVDLKFPEPETQGDA